ncbi:MAG: hypothetical protein ACREFX_00715 [Opitutaceae bacterium]
MIVAGQALAWFAALRGFIAGTDLIFVPANVIAGQWWRVFAFVLLPPAFGLSINAVLVNGFAWWLFYIMGSALEGYWGAFRYNLFLIAGYMLTVAAGFAFPFSMVTNLFIGGSVFLAFAYLNPDFQLAILLVIPVRIKWLALAAWIYGLVQFVLGGWPERLQLLAAVGNFFLFFGHDLWLTARMRSRRMSSDAARLAASRTAAGPRHRCRVCGKTDRTNPEMDFRYCSKCAGEQCYCPEHIFNHAHVTDETVAAEKEKRS